MTMTELTQANWLALGLAAIAVLLVALWLYRRATSRPRQRSHAPDALDEGVAPVRRNQALIDAPSAAAAALASTGPTIIGGVGELVGVAAADAVVAAAPTAIGESDDLTRIKGVGPKLVALLGSLGIIRFDQIAAWDDAEAARIDAQLGQFAGRIGRDSWIEQCRYLAAGDTAGFEDRFGKL